MVLKSNCRTTLQTDVLYCAVIKSQPSLNDPSKTKTRPLQGANFLPSSINSKVHAKHYKIKMQKKILFRSHCVALASLELAV